MSLLQGTPQVAAPLEVGFQQSLTAGHHPTHAALVWTAPFPAYKQDTTSVKQVFKQSPVAHAETRLYCL